MRSLTLTLRLVVLLALTAPAAAASHKILVLPVDGTADAATRSRLTADIVRLARTLEGQVTTGNATFADTALAVGCDPRAVGCSDEVIATLGVDELVWGTATRDGGQTRLTVRRAARGEAVRDVSTTIAPGDTSDRITTGIAPLFAPPVATPEPPPRAPAPPPHPPAPPPPAALDPQPAPGGPADVALPTAPGPAENRRDRTVGIALVTGGGLGVVLGLALWASYASLQGQIDDHPARTMNDIDDLKALEDTASSRAIGGDVLVVAGLAVAGLGGYYLYRDHKRHAIAIAPAPIPHGAGLTITVIGGL